MFGLKWHHGVTLSWKASKWDNYRESLDVLDKLTDGLPENQLKEEEVWNWTS